MGMKKELKGIFFFFFILQIMSLDNMYSSGYLNGDFMAIEVNNHALFLSFCFSFIPILILFKVISLLSVSSTFPIFRIYLFDKLVLILLLINLYFSFVYKVGLFAQDQIYQVPIYLKPIVVFVNKFDVYLLAGILLFSRYYNKGIMILTVLFLIILSLSRGSIFVFLFLMILFIGNGLIKFSLRNILFILFFIFVTFEYVPKLYEFRDNLRGKDVVNLIDGLDPSAVITVIKSKILGRISNLSSIAYFYQIRDVVARSSDTVGTFDYIIEFFRPFYGGFFVENQIGYTYYFTNLFDDKAGSSYGVMYGLPNVFLLSWFKGFHVLLLNFAFLILVIFVILRISSYLFGAYYKEFSAVILYYPIMSGVSSELGQLLLYLLVIAIFKLLLMNYTTLSSSPLRN